VFDYVQVQYTIELERILNGSDVNKATTPKAKAKVITYKAKAKATPPHTRLRPKPRMSENATAVIWLKHGTVYLAKHLEIWSNSYTQHITHMQMLVPCCHTSLLHFKYMSVSSNESDMRVQAKANAMTFKGKGKGKGAYTWYSASS